MKFRFNFEKTLQASAVLLRRDGKRMSRLRLLKLLYIADRELLAAKARTITGDRVVAMKYGPVLSQTYDLIKGLETRASEWDEFIHSDGYAIELKNDPGLDDLSKAEIAKLQEVADRYRDVDDEDLSTLTHDFPEWKNHAVSSGAEPIPWEEVLTAQNKEDILEIVESNAATSRSLDELFGTTP
jgi:uncharacterized phage-associated protein